jgi:hypothetical protein
MMRSSSAPNEGPAGEQLLRQSSVIKNREIFKINNQINMLQLIAFLG